MKFEVHLNRELRKGLNSKHTFFRVFSKTINCLIKNLNLFRNLRDSINFHKEETLFKIYFYKICL